MSGDKPVEQRQHDEVEHDRDDHFVGAESGLEIGGDKADDSAGDTRRNHADRKRQQKRRADRQREARQSRRETSRRELAFSSDVEQPGAQSE